MIVDELLVVLGIDARQFNEGQREALETFRKTQQGADEFSKSVERNGMKLSEVFGIVRRGALGIAGAFIGGEVAGFINHVASMDAATGRFAKTIGTAVENLSTWQNMIRMRGGESGAATSVLSTLQNQIEMVRQGSGMFEGAFADLANKSGVNLRDNADTVLRKIRSYVGGEVASGRMTNATAATRLRSVPGMNEDMLNTLLLPTAEFDALAEAARKAGTATDQSAKAGQLLAESFTTLILKVEDMVRAITPFVNLLTKPFGEITKDDVRGAFGGAGIVTIEPGSPMAKLHNFLWGGRDKAFDQWWSGSASGQGKTRGDRNNNPGNIEYGPFAISAGATGTDGRFAIFPDRATGESAMARLLMGSYQGLTLAQIQRKWVGNDDPNYLAGMSRDLGIGPNEVPNLSDPAVREKLMRAMSRGEGTYLGAKSAAGSRSIDNSRRSSSTVNSEVSIGSVSVNAPNATDADGIAREIAPAIKRSSIAAPANYGLV